MKLIYTLLVLILFWNSFTTKAQNTISPSTTYTDFPIIVGVTFQSFALPFRDLKSNFTHVGFSIGTEIGLNKRKNIVQQIQATYFLNKEMGNGFAIYTQTAYRPIIYNHFYVEVKAGLGWQRIYHPVDAYEFKNGNWEKTVGGKSQLIVPLGFSIGYDCASTKTHIAPFITYQIIPALFYNDTVPLNFYSFFQLGTRIHLKSKVN